MGGDRIIKELVRDEPTHIKEMKNLEGLLHWAISPCARLGLCAWVLPHQRHREAMSHHVCGHQRELGESPRMEHRPGNLKQCMEDSCSAF